MASDSIPKSPVIKPFDHGNELLTPTKKKGKSKAIKLNAFENIIKNKEISFKIDHKPDFEIDLHHDEVSANLLRLRYCQNSPK